MSKLLLATFFLVILSTSVGANLSSSLIRLSQSSRIHARQSGFTLGDLPPICRTTCTPAVTVANDPKCQLPSCQCTVDLYQALAVCFDCIVFATGGSLAVAQVSEASLEGFSLWCVAGGFPIGARTSIVPSPAPSFSATDLNNNGGAPARTSTTPAQAQTTISTPGNTPNSDNGQGSFPDSAFASGPHSLKLVLGIFIFGVIALA